MVQEAGIMKKSMLVLGLVVMAGSVMTVSAVNIDGTITAGEWAGAATYTIGNGGGTAYLMADENYAYGAFDITGWTATMGAASHGNLLGFGVWKVNGGYGGTGVEFQQATDSASWGDDGVSGTMNGLSSAFRIDAQSPPASSIPGNLQAMDSFATGHRVWEVMMPISSMLVSEGDYVYFVGGINYEGATHWYPDELLWNSYAPVKVKAGTSVPDGGMTLGLLGLALTGLAGLRRKLSL